MKWLAPCLNFAGINADTCQGLLHTSVRCKYDGLYLPAFRLWQHTSMLAPHESVKMGQGTS